MKELTQALLLELVGTAPDGIVVCDARAADQPVVYVNSAFERMSGYSAHELIGQNPRLLQGRDRDQEGRRRLREALDRGEASRVLIRNSRKDGSPLWNEMNVLPLRDAAGVVTHFVGFHRDAGERVKAPERPLDGLPSWMREDRLTGLASRAWFEELLLREWSAARREARLLSVLLFEIDGLAGYSDTFGRTAAESCIRTVSRVIGSSYRRGVDLTGRWEHGCIAVMVSQAKPELIADYAVVVAQRVVDLRIHNPRDPVQKFISVTAGVASCRPGHGDAEIRALLEAADGSLRQAKHEGRGRVRATKLGNAGDAGGADQPPGGETTAMTPNPG